jgi:hypothetical protein
MGKVKPGRKEGNWNEAKNMGDWPTYLNYNAMGDLLFGKRFNCGEQGLPVCAEAYEKCYRLCLSGAYCFRAWVPRALTKVQSCRTSPLQRSWVLLMVLVGGQMARDEIAYVEYANA